MFFVKLIKGGIMCNKCQELIMKQRYQVLLLKSKGYNMTEISQIARVSRDTLYRWQANKQRLGLKGLHDLSTRPKSHPIEYSLYVKELIKYLRNKYQVGPDKIRLKLIKFYNINISVSGIAKELKRTGLIKTKKRKRKNKCQHFKKKRYLPGDIIQIDIKFVFKTRQSKLFQFSAIDLDTCLSYSSIIDSFDNYQSIRFLKHTNLFYPFKVKSVQTDNASYFTNYYTGYPKSSDPQRPKLHPFDKQCHRLKIEHYLIDKGKPQQNGKVERFHRTVDDEFYNRYSFRNKVHLLTKFQEYLYYYNHHREHLGLKGLTPLEKLQSYQQYKHITSIPDCQIRL